MLVRKAKRATASPDQPLFGEDTIKCESRRTEMVNQLWPVTASYAEALYRRLESQMHLALSLWLD